MKLKSILLSCFAWIAIYHMAAAQTLTVSGTVKDAKGTPVASASIRVKGTQAGVKSDSLGGFSVHAMPYAALLISAIGYNDTSISVNNQTSIIIVLTRQAKSLAEVVVAHTGQDNNLPATDETAREQMLSYVMEDYLRGENITEGIKQFNGLQIGERGGGGFHLVSTGPTGTINYGALLPEFTHKEDTRGNKYLFDQWVKGLVVTSNDSVIHNSSYLFNYDKLSGDLLLTQDMKTMITLDKPQIKSFALKGTDTAYIFERVPAINDAAFVKLVAWGPRYRVYRTVKTTFVKADHVTNGLTESGNFYDEYVDSGVYYMVDHKNNTARKFDLKKKSILEALPEESTKTGNFITTHKHDDINDDYIKALINALNQ